MAVREADLENARDRAEWLVSGLTRAVFAL